jgi:hypothetical protein
MEDCPAHVLVSGLDTLQSPHAPSGSFGKDCHENGADVSNALIK